MTRFLLSASLLALSSNALAQTPDDVHDHDDIIVTGVLADRNADEIVANVSVLDRDEILSDLRTTLGDTLDREPGVSTTFFGAGASRPVLRGLGAERVLVLTNGIGTIDVSAASPDHQVGADGIDAERIEILRGPAALAYGGQAIGGVVNVLDGLIAEELPEEDIEADAFGAWNSAFDGLEGAARASGALGPLVLSGSISARDFDDYDIPGEAESEILEAFEEALGEHEGEEHSAEEEGEEGVLENSFVETLTLSAGASFVFDNGFIGAAIRDTSSEYGLPGGHAHEEGEGEEGEEEEENPFIDLDQTRYDVRAGLDFEAGFLRGLRVSGAWADYFHTEFEAPGEAGTTYDREGGEGRVELRTGVADLEGVIGVQGLTSELIAEGEEAFITPTDTDSVAVFVYQRFKNEDSPFSVEGGLRGERVDYNNVVFGEADFDLLSASVAAHLHPVDTLFFGGEIAYTQRAPNESELFSDGVHLATRQFELGNPDLDVESGLNYELTARFDTGNTRIGGNFFVTDFDNFTTLLPGATVFEGELTTEVEGFPVFVFIQDGADFIGGEIYAETNLDLGGVEVALKGSVDYVEGELDSALGGNVDVPLLPPLTFNLEAAGQLGAVALSADLTVATDQNDPGPGQLPTDGYVDLGFGAAYDFGEFLGGREGNQLFVQVRNVLDEDIRFATSTLKDLAPAPGRNFRAGLRVAF